MNSRNTTTLLCLFAALASPLAFAADPQSFSDGFEAPTLDPFWTATQNAGSITIPSSVNVHSGQSSLQVNSISGAGQKNIGLSHKFATPQYGETSLWVYDSGADLSSGNYLALVVYNSQQSIGGLFTQDYDLGPSNGGNYYHYSYLNNVEGPNAASSIDRTKDWHHFVIDSKPQELTMEVDGQTVYTSSDGFAFDTIQFDMHGPGFRPAVEAYFDDFSFTAFSDATTRVPETASTAGLMVASLLSLAAMRKYLAVT